MEQSMRYIHIRMEKRLEIYIYILLSYFKKSSGKKSKNREKRYAIREPSIIETCFRAILEIKIKLIYKNMMYEITLSPSHCENMSISH